MRWVGNPPYNITVIASEAVRRSVAISLFGERRFRQPEKHTVWRWARMPTTQI
ncbi:MAG: hypothetical protein J6M43_01390 [Neisseriaceae bacterium]|nr:hypothetical protein [Neisseriaceae bacterium]